MRLRVLIYTPTFPTSPPPVLDEAVGELGDVHEPVLVHADVDEGAEGRDVGHRPLEQHPGFRSRISSTPSAKLAVTKPAADRARASRARRGCPDRRQAERLVDEVARVERLQPRLVAHQRAGRARRPRRCARRRRRRSGCTAEASSGSSPPRMRRKPAPARRPSVAERGTFEQVLAAAEGALLVAVGDDASASDGPRPGDMREQRRRGGVEIDADRVHRILDHRLERAPEAVLVDVVLVLADADRLRLDLDELGQRVLQPPGDRDRAAQRDVEVGNSFAPAPRRNRPRRPPPRRSPWSALAPAAAEHLGDELLGLAAGGAVADGDELDAVAADQRGERVACAPGTSFFGWNG